MTQDMGIDEFLGHKTSSYGDKAAYLGKWKEREERTAKGVERPAKSVDTWLHCRAPITSIWRHQFPRVVELTQGDRAGQTNVWSQNLVCHEDEATLRAQNKRDDDGRRLTLPQRCGVCKLIEWVRQEVNAGRLSWVEPLFRFKGDDKAVTLYAGGLYNAFAHDDLTDEDKAAMAKLGIYQREAWKQNAQAKAVYCFRVVDDEAPDKGVQVAVESALLGDKVKAVILETMENIGKEKGDPRRNPYAIRWKHLPGEAEFGKKYKAIRMELLKPSADVLRLIHESTPPDIGNLTRRFDAAEVRAQIEAFGNPKVVQRMPLDEFFSGAPPAHDHRAAPSNGGGRRDDADDKFRDAVGKGEAGSSETPGGELFECDGCDKLIDAECAKCPHCGHAYEVEQAAPPLPPPRRPKRSEALAARKTAAGKPVDPPAKPAPKGGGGGFSEPAPTAQPDWPGAGDDDEDSIPF